MAARRGKGGRFVKKARSAGRRVARSARRAGGFVRRHVRGRSLGLVGKTGVGIAAGAPIALSALDAVEGAVGKMRQNQYGLLTAAKLTAYQFLNGITTGFGMGNLTDTIYGHRASDGAQVSVDVRSGVPPGAWYKTSLVGGALVAFDIAISWASKKLAGVKSGVRFMGTKLTGGK